MGRFLPLLALAVAYATAQNIMPYELKESITSVSRPRISRRQALGNPQPISTSNPENFGTNNRPISTSTLEFVEENTNSNIEPKVNSSWGSLDPLNDPPILPSIVLHPSTDLPSPSPSDSITTYVTNFSSVFDPKFMSTLSPTVDLLPSYLETTPTPLIYPEPNYNTSWGNFDPVNKPSTLQPPTTDLNSKGTTTQPAIDPNSDTTLTPSVYPEPNYNTSWGNFDPVNKPSTLQPPTTDLNSKGATTQPTIDPNSETTPTPSIYPEPNYNTSWGNFDPVNKPSTLQPPTTDLNSKGTTTQPAIDPNSETTPTPSIYPEPNYNTSWGNFDPVNKPSTLQPPTTDLNSKGTTTQPAIDPNSDTTLTPSVYPEPNYNTSWGNFDPVNKPSTLQPPTTDLNSKGATTQPTIDPNSETTPTPSIYPEPNYNTSWGNFDPVNKPSTLQPPTTDLNSKGTTSQPAIDPNSETTPTPSIYPEPNYNTSWGNFDPINKPSTLQPPTTDLNSKGTTTQPAIDPNSDTTLTPSVYPEPNYNTSWGNFDPVNKPSTLQPPTTDLNSKGATTQPTIDPYSETTPTPSIYPEPNYNSSWGNFDPVNKPSTLQPPTTDRNSKGSTQPTIDPNFETTPTPSISPNFDATPPPLNPVVPIASIPNFSCHNGDGYYGIEDMCDNYFECQNLVPRLMVCPDGLVFNRYKPQSYYPCSYPSEVDGSCSLLRQPPRPDKACPHLYGYYAAPGDCSQYYMCEEGRPITMLCPFGLVFNEKISACDWPVNVPHCNPAAFENFQCPPPEAHENEFNIVIKKFRYQNECTSYIACERGAPRFLSCPGGLVFDPVMEACLPPSFVPECNIPGPLNGQ